MTPYIVQFCDDPQKISTKVSYPKNIYLSETPHLKPPKNIEIQNFEPPKMTRGYVCMKISEHPTPGVETKWFIILFYLLEHSLNSQRLC